MVHVLNCLTLETTNKQRNLAVIWQKLAGISGFYVKKQLKNVQPQLSPGM